MAYMSQQKKKELLPDIKKVLARYNMKASLSVRNHSTLVCKIKSGPIDFLENDVSVNHYHIDKNYENVQRDFLIELRNAMSKGNWDKSDIMTDYHNVGWYIDIRIGDWQKEYVYVE